LKLSKFWKQRHHLKDEELDVIGELISNMYGAVEVHKMVKNGTDKKEFKYLYETSAWIDR
jgi:hypothetical protein